MRKAILAVVLVTLFCTGVMATTMPSTATYCVWRPMAPNASDDVSEYFMQVMGEWGYMSGGHEYIEDETEDYGWVEGSIYGPILHEPDECTVGAFLSELAGNHAAFFYASHSFIYDMVISVYNDQASAEYAAASLSGIHGIALEAVEVEPAPYWGIKLSSSEVDSRCNAQIVVDMGCYNWFRRNDWGNPLTMLGHDQHELGPGELTPQLTNFFGKLRFEYYPEDIHPFPEAFKHSFAEADALVDTLTMHLGGDVVLGPTFIPWESKHDERDGPGVLDVVFDLNLPCQGAFFVSSFHSHIATVTGVGFNGDGNMVITLDITGAGPNALECQSQTITSTLNNFILFDGGSGFRIQFTVDTTPMAGIEDFSVEAGTGLIRVSSVKDTDALIIEGSDNEAGPYIELVRVEKVDVHIGLTTVSDLPPYAFYRLREIEDDGNIIDHVIVSPRQTDATDAMIRVSTDDVEGLFEQVRQRGRNPTEQRLTILAPTFMQSAAEMYRDVWSWYIGTVDLIWIDDLWGGTTAPDVFRANEKDLLDDLIAQGHDTFLLIGDASDAKEIQTPWPVEYGWEDYRQDLLAGDYTPQPEKNIHPSPVYWYDPVLSQDSGVNLPYFFSDWLLLDNDGDDWPEPGLVVGRLPFSEEWQLWNYLYKLMELLEYGLTGVPITTLALVGDVNHAGEFDGDHAVDVMGGHLESLQWPVFTMLESEHGSELTRASHLRAAWQDPEQMWNYVVCVASYSTRYRLGNWITMAFSLEGITPAMTHHPFMFLNSCTTGNYWWTENGGVSPRLEYLLRHANGASGLFAHSDGSWQEPNRSLGVAFQEIVHGNPGQSWGVSAMQAIQACKDLGPRERINALRSVLLSDPVLEPVAFNPDPQIVVSVEDEVPPVTRLNGNYPNPFNPTTTISYEVSGDADVQISIYDARGSLVTRLVDEHRVAGSYRVVWDGSDISGQPVASGLYFCRMMVGDALSTSKLALIK